MVVITKSQPQLLVVNLYINYVAIYCSFNYALIEWTREHIWEQTEYMYIHLSPINTSIRFEISIDTMITIIILYMSWL